jgi:hypothetical protein
MPAKVELNLLRPDDPRTRQLLDSIGEQMDWQVALQVEPDNRVEMFFVGVPPHEASGRVKSALDAAGEDWADYFSFASSR